MKGHVEYMGMATLGRIRRCTDNLFGRSRWTTAAALALFIAVTLGPVLARRPLALGSNQPLNAPRVVVLKAKRILHLFDGGRLIRSYPIDLGLASQGPKRYKADGRTPEGRFRIVTKNAQSEFHRFLGLNYPDATAVDYGLGQGLISSGEAVALRGAHHARRAPDWTTALGGGIGIHGHGQGSDWTAGCIALSDEMAAELFDVLRIGDPVEILP